MNTGTLSPPPASLAPALQGVFRAFPHETIEMPERLAGTAQTKAVVPAAEVTAESSNQFGQGCVALLRADELAQHFLISPMAPDSPRAAKIAGDACRAKNAKEMKENLRIVSPALRSRPSRESALGGGGAALR